MDNLSTVFFPKPFFNFNYQVCRITRIDVVTIPAQRLPAQLWDTHKDSHQLFQADTSHLTCPR
jgi:hypothetical protein